MAPQVIADHLAGFGERPAGLARPAQTALAKPVDKEDLGPRCRAVPGNGEREAIGCRGEVIACAGGCMISTGMIQCASDLAERRARMRDKIAEALTRWLDELFPLIPDSITPT